MARERITILGDGQMGLVSALALVSAAGDAGSVGVAVWGHDPTEAGSLAQSRTSPRLPGFELDPRVLVTSDSAEALDGATLIVSAIPTQFTRAVWEGLREHVPAPRSCPVISVSKGIENGTLLTPLGAIASALDDDPDAPSRSYCVLSGPTIAAELARCLPATMIGASDDADLAARVQGLFSTSWLRIYTGSDPLGVELAGAMKNVIAIAAGIIDGLQAGANAKSALLSRGLAEISRLGSAMGASRETFFGLAGVGDLATTCFSPEGRNRSCGEALGKGEALDVYLARTKSVVEGVATTKSVMELARKYRVELPIVEAVHAVLYEKLDPIDAIAMLMSRELREERVG